MDRWPITRMWTVANAEGARHEVTSSDLLRLRCCAFLGAAGLGKTFELRYLQTEERRHNDDVKAFSAVELAACESLAGQLRKISASVTPNSIIYLDAIDEAIIPVQAAAQVIATWIRTDLHDTKPRLRMACRSAVWPRSILDAITDVYGNEAKSATLLPLSEADIAAVVGSCGVDAVAFAEAVRAAKADTLASHPMTLTMLLRLFKDNAGLPKDRNTLFEKAITRLASERVERREADSGVTIPLQQLVDAAERIACLSVLSGREAIDLRDTPSHSCLHWIELADLPCGSGPSLDERLIRAVSATALFEADGPNRFRFAHRQWAEYLAGRRIARLPAHQAKALLAEPRGWEAGVAGPLRETAAVAAAYNGSIARWIAESDPELIGVSDVADESLRRRGALQLLGYFRTHKLTDAQLSWDGLELRGFGYAGMEADLRRVLRERFDGCEDVLECAVDLAETFSLSGLSDDLATLALDRDAPLHARKSAGYALRKLGSANARHRLKSLIAGEPGDEHHDLKGVALRCNWPTNLTVSELLAVLTPCSQSYYGAYAAFLSQLDKDAFDASDDVLAGLSWAKAYIANDRHHDPINRIVRRICHRAVQHIDEPAVVSALASILVAAAASHIDSPLNAVTQHVLGNVEPAIERPAATIDHQRHRRNLLDAIARQSADVRSWWLLRQTPGIVVPDDFDWLMDNALCSDLPMEVRTTYAEFIRLTEWTGDSSNIDRWLEVRHLEPIASVIGFKTQINLDTEEARKQRQWHIESRKPRDRKRKKLRPSAAARVEQMLSLAEEKDPRYFLNLCRELTLTDESAHYGYSTTLKITPGWTAASEQTRERIRRAAKRLLTNETKEFDRTHSEPLNTILPGYMPALLLLGDFDQEWLHAQTLQWWSNWCGYILREVRLGMSQEPDAPKKRLLSMAYAKAATAFRDAFFKFCDAATADSAVLVRDLLRWLVSSRDPEIDTELCRRLAHGSDPNTPVRDIVQFLLPRCEERVLEIARHRFREMQNDTIESEFAVGLLLGGSSAGKAIAFDYMRAHAAAAERICGEFAHGHRFRQRDADEEPLLSTAEAGELTDVLLQTFPPETDPKREGASFVGPADSARYLRDQLISRLGDENTAEAVAVLQQLERKYGVKYPWLRRPRARAERAMRLASWSPIPLSTTAEVLAASDRRLIRSATDAADAILHVITEYENRLRHEPQSDLDDFWNRPKKQLPSPKEEERLSDKLCNEIHAYFDTYAVTADREVQIHRRLLPSADGGEPGSELDVLVRVPAKGTSQSLPIAIPIEVKWAFNKEAKTALKAQLVDRYMAQLGVDVGVFIVGWAMAPRLDENHRPVWASIDDARKELQSQQEDIARSSKGLKQAIAVVFDVSLRTGTTDRQAAVER